MRCDRLHATIRVSQCITNQTKRLPGAKGNETGMFCPTCKGCDKGKQARLGLLNDDDVERMIVAVVTGGEKTETKTCNQCGKEKSLDDYYRVWRDKDIRMATCKACKNLDTRKRKIEKKARMDRMIKELEVLEKDEHESETRPLAGEPHATPFVLSIDLTGYPELYEEIKLIAEHEERTPEAKVRYWLRNHLRTKATQGVAHAE